MNNIMQVVHHEDDSSELSSIDILMLMITILLYDHQEIEKKVHQ